jgi:hypothetical protein
MRFSEKRCLGVNPSWRAVKTRCRIKTIKIHFIAGQKPIPRRSENVKGKNLVLTGSGVD